MNHETQQLAPPTVSPEVYDAEYYLRSCAGSEDWVASGGKAADARYAGSLARAGLRPGDVLLDIGTGRGELLAAAIEAGAARAIGVEYSAAAVALARTTLDEHGVRDRATVIAADARRLPLPSGSVDLVTLLDVVEHLTPDELQGTLVEAHRVLRGGGRVFAHTLPTRTIYDVTYRLQRLSRPSRWKRWPADPRNDFERAMHVNEQTLGSLRRALFQAGFRRARVTRGEWIHDEFVPDEGPRRLYGRLAAHRLTRGLGAADLWAEGVKEG
jgi:ubiquinone/menaquinone biosynthesis C-methylase UbiE